MKNTMLIVLVLIAYPIAYAEDKLQQACNQYYTKMKSLPHINIQYEINKTFTYLDNKSYTGCSIEVDTKWSLVGESFNQYSVLKLPGWEHGDFMADSPGSSTFNVIKGGLFCMVGYDFMAYFDEQINSLITGDELNLYAQCGMK